MIANPDRLTRAEIEREKKHIVETRLAIRGIFGNPPPAAMAEAKAEADKWEQDYELEVWKRNNQTDL